MIKRQRGSHVVEFSIVGSVFFLLFFGAFEVGRLLYTWHGLDEAARRGARVAVVCPLNESAIKNVAVFGDPETGDDRLYPGLTTDKVTVSYLDDDGVAITLPEPMTDAVYGTIENVRVEITDYEHQFIIPGLPLSITAPTFATTLPRESLGVSRTEVSCPFF